MKTLFKCALITVFAGLVCAAATTTASRGTTKIPYAREQTKGKVRVILLRIDRSTIFTDGGSTQTNDKTIYAVPGLRAVYVIEALGDEPVTNRWMGDCSAYVGKSKLIARDLPGRGEASANDFRGYHWGSLEKRPDIKDPRRATIHEVCTSGLQVPGNEFDLHIQTGFNEHKEEFVFERIPVE